MLRHALSLTLLLTACDSLKNPATTGATPGREVQASADASSSAEPWQAGALREGPVSFSLAVYGQDGDPAALKAAATKAVEAHSSSVKVDLEFPAIETFAPPAPDMLAFIGVGLSPEEVKAVQGAKAVAVLRVSVSDPSEAETAMNEANALVAEIATASDGLPWDEETRQLFARDEWAKRVEFGPDKAGERWRHFTTHNYRDGELIRQVTLGLGKFGLPEIANEGVAAHEGETMGALINLVAETMVDGAVVGEGGTLPISTPDGKTVTVHLGVGTKQEGDAPGRLLVLRYPGTGSLQQRQVKLLESIYGPMEGKIMDAEAEDAELLAASAKAKQELAKLEKHFAGGVPDLEHLSVKAPFSTDDGGIEWMWVEVTQWNGAKMKGILQNAPRAIAGLQRGATVEVEVDALFDYIHSRGDGSSAGGTTNDILERRHGG